MIWRLSPHRSQKNTEFSRFTKKNVSTNVSTFSQLDAGSGGDESKERREEQRKRERERMHWSVITKFVLSSRFRKMCWIWTKWTSNIKYSGFPLQFYSDNILPLILARRRKLASFSLLVWIYLQFACNVVVVTQHKTTFSFVVEEKNKLAHSRFIENLKSISKT